MKKTKEKVVVTDLAIDKKPDDTAFDKSISVALKQKNEKGFLTAIVFVSTIIALLLVSAVADILTLCFQVNEIFGYVMSGALAVLLCVFVVRPIVKVIGARYFVTDVTSDTFDVANKRNYKVLKSVAISLVEYNLDPKNIRFRYLTDEKITAIKTALANGDKYALKKALKDAYATDVAGCVNALIWKSAGKVFLTTSISQNDKIDALSALLVNLTLVKQIVCLYGYRPSYAKLFRVYFTVLRSALVAYGMQNVNWFNVFSKFFSGVAKKIPFLDTVVDSAVQGTVSAFMTVLVGYKTKRYLCSDYKKQEKLELKGEKLETTDGAEVADDEVKIAAELAKEIRIANKDKIL